jgi:hypothetical protein
MKIEITENNIRIIESMGLFLDTTSANINTITNKNNNHP